MTKNNEFMQGFYQNLGHKILTARLTNKLSQNTVSSKIGISIQQLQKYESGKNKICIARLICLSNFFKKDISYFIDTASAKKVEISKSERVAYKLLGDFLKIKNEACKMAIKDLVEELSKVETEKQKVEKC